MLEAKTIVQKLTVYNILRSCGESVNEMKGGREPIDYVGKDCVNIESYDDHYCLCSISFDTMAKVVDYLRKEAEEIELPHGVRFSTVNGYDLRNVNHIEVMRFIQELVDKQGRCKEDLYMQYVKTGKIRL